MQGLIGLMKGFHKVRRALCVNRPGDKRKIGMAGPKDAGSKHKRKHQNNPSLFRGTALLSS